MSEIEFDTFAFEAWRAELAAAEQAEAISGARDMQHEMRQSGARQKGEHSFQTNQGVVILMSPADLNRLALMDGLQSRIDRRRGWSEPGHLGGHLHAMPGLRR